MNLVSKTLDSTHSKVLPSFSFPSLCTVMHSTENNTDSTSYLVLDGTDYPNLTVYTYIYSMSGKDVGISFVVVGLNKIEGMCAKEI